MAGLTTSTKHVSLTRSNDKLRAVGGLHGGSLAGANVGGEAWVELWHWVVLSYVGYVTVKTGAALPNNWDELAVRRQWRECRAPMVTGKAECNRSYA